MKCCPRESLHCFCFMSFSFLEHKHRHRRNKRTLKKGHPSSIFSDLETLRTGIAANHLSTTSKQPNGNDTSQYGPHRRAKRFLSYPRFVEVMVVADSKMVEHHGNNLQHYILTLMSVVSMFGFLFLGECGGIKRVIFAANYN